MPKEVISIGEALYAHTKGAAKALSRDDIGTIAVGKKADFTILSKNLLEVTEEEILETEVVATIFNGEVI
jgi:predicted amidohydrolase YtcJ